MNDRDKALNYYRAGVEMRVPDYVPARVRIASPVCGDPPFSSTRVEPGDYDCDCGRYGALSVQATDGSMLGIKPTEFEPLTWRPNAT